MINLIYGITVSTENFEIKRLINFLKNIKDEKYPLDTAACVWSKENKKYVVSTTCQFSEISKLNKNYCSNTHLQLDRPCNAQGMLIRPTERSSDA